ncbi:MAG: DNA-binding protein HU-beta [Patescibacteria group bacterium]|nr:DNA-binding protein HU-beta [Patescibacteria group bacterium]
MTKNELIQKLADDLNMPKAQVRRMTDAMVDTVSKTLGRGEKVQISGLGTFHISKRKQREGRNPQTGAKMTISARNVVVFKTAKPLKETVK